MSDNLPTVSIIIPCRNEEKFIGKCLGSVIEQDYPKENLEILVVDGRSEDKTKEIVSEFSKKYLNIRLLENPKKIVSAALNIGIRESRGAYILRADAHSVYDENYISKSIEFLEKTGAACVGGPMRAVGDNYLGKAIAFIHHSRFGIGVAKFHNENTEGWADTVYLGCYQKEIFDKIGLYNEKLTRTEDIELNSRLRKIGGKIFLTPQIKSFYHCRPTLGGLFHQNFLNGFEVIRTAKEMFYAICFRHLVPLFFTGSLILSLIFSPFFLIARTLFVLIFGAYLLVNLFFSIKISLKEGIQYLFILPLVFFIFHFSYGFGSIWGLVKLIKD